MLWAWLRGWRLVGCSGWPQFALPGCGSIWLKPDAAGPTTTMVMKPMTKLSWATISLWPAHSLSSLHIRGCAKLSQRIPRGATFGDSLLFRGPSPRPACISSLLCTGVLMRRARKEKDCGRSTSSLQRVAGSRRHGGHADVLGSCTGNSQNDSSTPRASCASQAFARGYMSQPPTLPVSGTL